jgi:iron complex transport system substrate-binding protein
VSFNPTASSVAVLAALVVISICAPAVRAEPIRASDDRGQPILLSAPARRVVTLAPHLTELIFAAGGAASLVGVDRFSDYPAAAAGLPRVGDAAGLDLERILALRPDLVFGWLSGNKPSDIDRLEQLGVKLFLSEPRHLGDVPRTLRVMGKLLGSAAAAEQEARAFEQRLQAMQVQVTGLRAVPVFFEIWHHPLMTWDKHPRMRAVQRKQIYQLAPDLITRATPRVLDGTEKTCEWLRQARGAGR